jgi:hypothetical protein
MIHVFTASRDVVNSVRSYRTVVVSHTAGISDAISLVKLPTLRLVFEFFYGS